MKLFSEHPDIAEKWQNRLRYLLVDEYQDTNACQYQLLKLLTGVRAQFWRWATTTRRSTAGAAPTSTT